MNLAPVDAYLILPEIIHLQRCVTLADTSSKLLGSRTPQIEHPSKKQIAIVGLGSSAYSVFFGILPLLQAGLLVPAAVLLRSFMERIATIAWLSKGDDRAVTIYTEEWNDLSKRPGIRVRLKSLDNYIGDRLPPETEAFHISDFLIEKWLNILHGYTHGDDEQSQRHAKLDGEFVQFAAGADPRHPKECAALANLAVILFGQFFHELGSAIPQLRLTR